MSDSNEVRVTLELEEGYAFRVRFDDTALADLHTDESAPIGAGSGPDPVRMLLTAVANCLSASLLFALRKFRNQPGALRATIVARQERNAQGRLRVPRARVELQLAESADSHHQLDRILAMFEDFCVVTQSVRQGIEVEVGLRDAEGRVLLGGGGEAST